MPKKIKKRARKLSSARLLARPKPNIGRINPVRKLQGVQETKKTDMVSNEVKKTKIRVIGIGGGGGSIVSEIASRMEKASFVVANTDVQALRTSGRKVVRFPFGQALTHGLGAGMNSELGREAAQNEKDKIKKLLEGQDLCILVACLGGGTGSGAAPVFAKISKSLGNLTYGIFTLPFKFEGEKKMEIAKDSLERIKSQLNAFSVIPNERAFQIIDKNTPLKQALSAVNKNLTESLGGLIETIYEPGLINIDFADFKTILGGRGRLAYLNTAEVQRKDGSVKDLIARVLNSSLYPYGIRGGKGVLFNIAGKKELSLTEVNQISNTISELVNPEAKIIFGISHSQKYADTIKTTLLVTGCGMKFSLGKKAKKKKTKKRRTIRKPIFFKKKKENNKKEKNASVSNPKKTVKQKRRKRKKSPDKNQKKEQVSAGSETGYGGADKISAEQRKELKSKKIKIKIPKESKKKLTVGPDVKAEEIKALKSGGAKVRKNAIQVKQEFEEIEKEMIEKEKFWERPAFLRRKTKKA